MASESTRSFEMPADMLAFAEKGMQQARQAFESMLAATQHAVLTAGTQFSSLQTGAKETGELALQFAERNVTSAFEFAERLVRAKDAQEVVALHAEYARKQMEALGAQAKELGKKVGTLGGQHSP